LLSELASVSAAVAAAPGRLAKIDLLADCLRRAGPGDVPVVVAYLSGVLPQRQIGVGWAALRDAPAPAATSALTVAAVHATFDEVGAARGAGATGARRALLGALFAQATAAEQSFLRALLAGELRQGALDGVMVDAVARAAEVPVAEIRRALMLRGSLGSVAAVALSAGVAGLREFRLEVGRPLLPMLAGTASDTAQALTKLGPAAVEWKLDGVRAQVHKSGSQVGVFTRTLDDITSRVPEVVEAALALPERELVLDGELIALDEQGRPRPFQVTSSRIGSRSDAAELRAAVPLRPFLFDILHAGGADLLDLPYEQRQDVLEGVVPAEWRTPRVADVGPEQAAEFFAGALAAGHEGVVVKGLSAPYAAGRRGAGWLKVKPRHTLDLVVLAAEWGHGRRRGWLSNLHLGARGSDGAFLMLGKTFKGLTDQMLVWQTERLLELQVSADEWTVRVRPELVVEVAFDGVQTSSRYPGGLALRFARVLRHRPDKPAAEADTFAAVQATAAAR
jgi:DNA ligase-1